MDNDNEVYAELEKDEKRAKLAHEVLVTSRNQLLVNLRFLDAALSRLTEARLFDLPYATDGKFLAYDPKHVLRTYKLDRAAPVRDYLHVILHCLFRHMFVHTLINHAAWDLSCDIAVEYVISELGIKAAESGRAAKQRAYFDSLKKVVGKLTAEKLYRYYINTAADPAEMAKLRGLFFADDHSVWYMNDKQKNEIGFPTGSGDGKDDDESALFPVCSEEDWQQVSERVQMDMETFSKMQGKNPGGLIQNLREVNRERYDYTSFLRRFAVRGEVMKINDDEFDYIFYTYGLKLYDNMPLVEPLEYKEIKRIREFVIAIDTSGSAAGETVQKFVQKTWNILKSTESFFSKINLHIIQCDADVQEDAKITSQEEFDDYIKTMKIRGLGGTDFRPVFEYVDKLREQKEFTNLKGLIYFTDGYGEFPAKMPEYLSAFVFLDEENNSYEVPPWAIKLILRKEEI